MRLEKKENRHRESGFTLTEVMVVMVIVAIMSTVAFASFGSWFAKNRVNGAVRQLHTEMHRAKMKAIAENNPYRIDFDTTNHAYTIFDDGTTDHTITIGDAFEDIEFGWVTGTTNFSGGAITSAVTFSSNSVTFSPNGLLSGSGGTVYLMPAGETRAKLQRSIAVNIVGRITYRKYNGSNWE